MRFNFLQLGRARGAQEGPSLTPGPGTLPPQTSMLPPLFCQLCGGPEKFCLARGHPAVGRLSRLCCGPPAAAPPPARLPAQSEHSVVVCEFRTPTGDCSTPAFLEGRVPLSLSLSPHCSPHSWVEAASVVLNQDTVPL